MRNYEICLQELRSLRVRFKYFFVWQNSDLLLFKSSSNLISHHGRIIVRLKEPR